MEIAENRHDLLPDFIRLNEEWISTYFEIEDVDRALAANPGRVIDNGGYIFSLLVDDAVVGVCALFNEGDGAYELERMAVSPQFQGRGYGDILIKAAIDKLAQVNAKKVSLVSNTKLQSALSLYRKHNFEIVFEGQHRKYSRANVVMERPI